MDKLWAPWRLEYVQSCDQADGCFLCHAIEGDQDKENLVVWRGERCACVLNKFPYNNGHLLIAPVAHKGGLEELDDEELLACQHAIRRMMAGLGKAIHPHGFNVGLNVGRVAGAGLPGHLHWHIVPRWDGDTNFMPILGEVKVISQSLEHLYDLLTEAL